MLPVPPADKFDAVKHADIKDIQEYKNFSYLDATLYGMFAYSKAFDNLFVEEVTSETNVEEFYLQKLLKSEIINPFRKYVRYDNYHIRSYKAMYITNIV